MKPWKGGDLITCPHCLAMATNYEASGLCSWCWWLRKHGYTDGHEYCKAMFPEYVVEKSH